MLRRAAKKNAPRPSLSARLPRPPVTLPLSTALRMFGLGAVAIVASGYAIVRHYGGAARPSRGPAVAVEFEASDIEILTPEEVEALVPSTPSAGASRDPSQPAPSARP